MKPGRLEQIRSLLLHLNPRMGAMTPMAAERLWYTTGELIREIDECYQTLEQIATAPLLDMTPVQKAVVLGFQEMARRRLSGE
jgi:hypothetical protein